MRNESLPPGPEEKIDLDFSDNALEILSNYKSTYGQNFKIYSPYRKAYTYVIGDPELVKHVLVNNSKNYIKGVGLERVKILLGNGIMVSEGDYWRRQRRMIQPSFHKKVIAELSKKMHSLNSIVAEKWRLIAEQGKTLNITKEMSELTLDIVLNSIFSKDLDRLVEEKGENPFHLVTEESSRDLQFAFKFRSLASHVKKFKKERELENRIEPDFLSMLMETRDKETGEKMTEKELLDEVMTLIVAGHETTAATLNWVWYLLATHKKEDNLLFDEVKNLNGRIPDFDDLNDLAYTEKVIKEAMRLYPPGWLLTRRAIEKDSIGPFHTEPKTDVFISPYLIQRDPELWDDPDKFDPERFDPEKVTQRHKFSYFPFSGGARQCIGDFFAMVEMKIHIGFLAQKFSMEYIDEGPIELEPQVNLRPKRDITLRPHLR